MKLDQLIEINQKSPVLDLKLFQTTEQVKENRCLRASIYKTNLFVEDQLLIRLNVILG